MSLAPREVNEYVDQVREIGWGDRNRTKLTRTQFEIWLDEQLADLDWNDRNLLYTVYMIGASGVEDLEDGIYGDFMDETRYHLFSSVRAIAIKDAKELSNRQGRTSQSLIEELSENLYFGRIAEAATGFDVDLLYAIYLYSIENAHQRKGSGGWF